MRLAILGGTGRTGAHVVDAAVAAGHEIRVLSRGPYARPGALEVRGDALDPERLRALVRGVDAVVCVLGPTPSGPADVCSRATALLVEAMKAEGVRRLVVQTGAMVGHPALDLFYRWLSARAGLRPILDERRRQEELVQASGLDWTLVRPPRLTEGKGTGAARVGARLPVRALSSVARVDLAQVLLRAATTPGWKGQAVTALKGYTPQRPAVVLREWTVRMGAAEAAGIGVAAAVAVGLLASFGEPATTAGALGFLVCMLAAGGFEGLLLGALPGGMLASCFPELSLPKFRRNTLVVVVGAWLVGMLPSTWLAGQPSTAAAEPSGWQVAAVSAIGGAVAGGLIGFAQWLVLRRVVDRAARWIAASALGWALGLPLDMLAGMLPRAEDSWVKTAAVSAALGLGAGVLVAAPTGLLLVALLRERGQSRVRSHTAAHSRWPLVAAH